MNLAMWFEQWRTETKDEPNRRRLLTLFVRSVRRHRLPAFHELLGNVFDAHRVARLA